MYTCNKCKKTFNKKSNYLTHINRKTSCIPKSLMCDGCKKIFASNSTLKDHIEKEDYL